MIESEPVENNRELEEIYEADQKDRENWRNGVKWEAVKPRDDARRARIRELSVKGLLKTAGDYFHAAMIFQHGNKPEDFEIAMSLVKKSMKLGSEDGKQLLPKAEDRYLLSIGKAQIWGTQYAKDGSGKLWKLAEPFDKNAKADEERKEFGVNLTEKLKELNI